MEQTPNTQLTCTIDGCDAPALFTRPLPLCESDACRAAVETELALMREAAKQTRRTRDEVALDMADQLVLDIRKLCGHVEDAEGGPLLRIAITHVDTELRLRTMLVGAPPDAR